ncbi:MAG TPA: hypothetical protein VEG42_02610, partial [Thermoplasmata archaeon]|nr:hypothetical protein [Thermoplasmata archaeon]
MPATPTVRAPASTPLKGGGDRVVRLKRGEQPTHSSMTGFQRWAWRMFRSRVLAKPPDPTLDENLLKAHIRMRSDEYMAVVWATTVVVGVATLAVGILLAFLFATAGSLFIGILIGVLLPVFGTIGTFFVLQGTPASKAKERGRKIDRKISPAMSFISAMSSADVNVDQIFRELGRQKIYGEVAEEAAWITRDTELLGVDILTAIR